MMIPDDWPPDDLPFEIDPIIRCSLPWQGMGSGPKFKIPAPLTDEMVEKRNEYYRKYNKKRKEKWTKSTDS